MPATRYPLPATTCRHRLVRRGYDFLFALGLGLEFFLNHFAEVAQGLPILIPELAREVVHEAKSSDVVAARAFYRLARVKADVRVLEHDRVLRKPGIEDRVFHHEHLVRGDGVAAEREIARSVADRQSHLRLVPLAVAFDEGDTRERDVEDALRHAADLVETLLGSGVYGFSQAELNEPLRLVLRDERTHHCFGLRPQAAAPHDSSHPGTKFPGVERLVQYI